MNELLRANEHHIHPVFVELREVLLQRVKHLVTLRSLIPRFANVANYADPTEYIRALCDEMPDNMKVSLNTK